MKGVQLQPRRCTYSPVAPPPLQAVRRFPCFVVCVFVAGMAVAHIIFSTLFSHVSHISPQILQRWRFLCVPTLKIEVLHWVFSSRHNHQRHSWTCSSFKLWRLTLTHWSAARSWGTEKIVELFRYRNQDNFLQDQESTQLALLWIPVLLQSY